MAVHVIDCIHTMEIHGDKLVILVIGKDRFSSKSVYGLHNVIAVAVVDVLGQVAVLVPLQ